MEYLIVVDMQNDFISGSLGSEQAKAIVENVVKKVKNFDGTVIFTRDTHYENYLKTQEGKFLPVEHCIKGTWGYEICDKLKPFAENVVDKCVFGSLELQNTIKKSRAKIEKIELCGLCTDICVISNAVILKSAFPETEIVVNSALCVGVTNESHLNALNAMKALQIKIV